jgi:SsrA-binding protein
MTASAPVIKNRKASFEFHLLQSFTAGVVLTGTEVKSLRNGEANLGDAFCTMEQDELFIRNFYIKELKQGGHYNHEPKRSRKLLLNRHELKKISVKLKEKGVTLIPVQLYFNEKGFVKIEIALAKGKKSYDKREDVKKRDVERELRRNST